VPGLKLGKIKANFSLSEKKDLKYKNLGSSIDPAPSCNAIKCIKTKAAKTNGSKKCSEKNLFKVALLTEKPPQMTNLLLTRRLSLVFINLH